MHEYLKILGSVIPIFLIMGVGGAVRRRGILNEEADRTLLDLVVHLLVPCLILDHLVASEALRQSGNLWWSPILGFICTAGSVTISGLAAHWWKFKHLAEARTFAFTTGIANFGYIAIPLIAVIYGANALAVTFLFNLGTEIAFWMVGFTWLEGRSFFGDWRRLFTTPVRAVLLGIVINLSTAHFGVRLDPDTLDAASWGWPVKIVLDAIHFVGLCSIPMSLLMIGATMADFWGKFHVAHGWGVMMLGLLVRHLACPIAILLLACLPVSMELKETLVVQAAMPVGVFTLVLTRHHGGNVTVALQVIFASTAAAIVTIPLWVHFGMQWIGAK
jgi:predicted permease